MKNILTILILLATFTLSAQKTKVDTYTYTGRLINGVAPTIWDSGYMGAIYISKDTIYIKAANKKAKSWKYSIIKSKTASTGSTKRDKTITSYIVESENNIDDDISIKIVLTIQNKPTFMRPNSLQVVVRDKFTETNQIVDYILSKN